MNVQDFNVAGSLSSGEEQQRLRESVERWEQRARDQYESERRQRIGKSNRSTEQE